MFLAMNAACPRARHPRSPVAGTRLSVFARRRSTAAITRYAAAGDFIIVAFLVAQALDGALTYVGVVGGGATEGNPLLSWYFTAVGIGPALAGAKLLASACAVGLHISRAHPVLAALTVLYVRAAIVPWTVILSS
jgi:hypothetical protein